MTEAEKLKYQKRSAYVVWTLKKWLPKAIKEAEVFRQKVWKDSNPKNTDNPNNLVAVQIVSWKAVLERIEKLEREYEKGEHTK